MNTLSEKEFQIQFVARLKKEFEHYGKDARFYWYGNGLKPIGHKKRNDVAIFHNLKNIPSPIGVELKTGYSLNQTNKALHDQIEHGYAELRFEVPNEKWIGFFPTWAFSNIPLIESGEAYTNHYREASTFFIERFAWMANVAIIMQDKLDKGRLVFSLGNKRHYFDGQTITIRSWVD